MIKKCPKCGSEKLQSSSVGIRIKCMKCGWMWKRHRRTLERHVNLVCPDCDGQMIRTKVEYVHKGIVFGKYDAEVCEQCDTTYFTEKSAQEIEDRAKELGVFGSGI